MSEDLIQQINENHSFIKSQIKNLEDQIKPSCQCSSWLHLDEVKLEAIRNIHEKKVNFLCFSDQILKCDNLRIFVNQHPIIKKYFDNDTDIKKLFTSKPNYGDYNKNNVINIQKMMLNLCDLTKDSRCRSFIIMNIYNIILKNYQILCDYPKYHKTCILKWTQIYKEPIFLEVGQEINPYFNQWNQFFQEEFQKIPEEKVKNE